MVFTNGYGTMTMVIPEETTVDAEISKSKFKAKALEIFRHVELTGQPVVITDHGTPTLVLRKHVVATRGPRQRVKNSVIRYDAPFDSVAEDDWQALG